MQEATAAEVRRAVRGHLPVLDGVRGLAILLVFVHNVAGPNGPARGVGLKLFDVATNIGWIGVQLFFVLSGFLITGILLDTKGAPGAWRAFYMRRVLRIFPLYYAALLVAFAVMPFILGHPVRAASHAGWYFAYLQNWSPAIVTQEGAGKLVHFWSLAVEEQFYLVWPIVVLALGPRAFLSLALSLVVLAPVLRVAVLASGASIEWAYQGTFARMDALALGGLGAFLVRDELRYARWAPRLGRLCVILGVVLLALVVVSRGFARQQMLAQTAGYSVLALFFTALVLAGVQSAVTRGWLARALERRPMQVLGQYSYGLYVFHVPLVAGLHYALAYWIGVDFSGSLVRQVVLRLGFASLAMALTFAAAFVSYQLFEKRFLALKRFFVAARRT
jgi:peptidoglycan/LPS O-acetylase OafA/YrhL